MLRLRIPGLWLRIAWPFLLFVAIGSVALALWMQSVAQRRSHAVFAALAQTNADFFRDHRLALTERMAGYVSRMLNATALIRRESRDLLPEPDEALAAHRTALLALREEEGVARLGGGLEAIAASVDETHSLLLVRPVEDPGAFLLSRETLLVFAVFWLLSIALAWTIARGVVLPLRLLAGRLPHIADDADLALPGSDRLDEIGQLARAYLTTRTQLFEERARREKAERLALLGRMATGLAHEIHNPLSAIQMHAQLLELASPGELAQTAEASLPVLREESKRIECLVNQWMFLARPEPGRVKPVRLVDCVFGVIQTYRATAAHAGVEITHKIDPEAVVSADSRRLGQAVSNVLINAIQAMPSGGALVIGGRISGTNAELSFHDVGGGFSPEAIARHSELFYSEKEGGMGIGLSVTAEILQALGGALRVCNTPGGGAVVTLCIPLASAQPRSLS